MPHGHCYYWQPDILWSMVAGGSMHVIAYLAMAIALIYTTTRDLGPHSVWLRPFLYIFAAFIFACGIGHGIDVYTIWNPEYSFEAAWSILSGTVSIFTAAVTWLQRKHIYSLLGIESNDS